MRAADVSVVIPNFNGAHLLPDTLAALDAQSVAGFEVVVVDNGSADASLEVLTAHPRVRVVQLPRNLGFAGGVNAGIRAVHRQLVVILNSDARPEPRWLEELLAAARDSSPDVWSWGSVLVNEHGRVESAGDAWRGTSAFKLLRDQPLERLPQHPYEVFAPPGASPLCRRDVLMQLGGYDDRFFLYYEDVDLSWRARLQGYRALVVPAARVHHLGGATSRRSMNRTWFYIARNSLWCAVRCPPEVSVRSLVRATRREYASARTRGVGRAYATGRVAGLWGLPRQLLRRRTLQARRTVDVGELRAFLADQERMLSP